MGLQFKKVVNAAREIYQWLKMVVNTIKMKFALYFSLHSFHSARESAARYPKFGEGCTLCTTRRAK